MPTVFGLNRARLELTGLEEPEELWDRLQEATAQASGLAASNKKLAARVRVLERQLAEAGGLTDDELVAELPKRMSRALESAQGVASDIVRRAKKQEDAIRQKAEGAAAEILRQAEGQAAAMLRQARNEAAAHIARAQAEAGEILTSVQAQRAGVLSELEGEVSVLQQRIKLLERNQHRLVQAYDVVEQTLADARQALGRDDARRPAAGTNGAGTNGGGAGREPVPRPVRATRALDAEATQRSSPFRVFDWAPAASQAG